MSLAAVFALAFACAGPAPAPDDTGMLVEAVSDGNPDDVLPRDLTAEEQARMALDPSRGSETAYGWECDPDLYGFTGTTPERLRFPAEFEMTSGLVLGWPSWGCILPELTEIIRSSVGRAEITVLVPAEHETGAKACLRRRGISDREIAAIDWVTVDVDSVWIRDYGPEFLVDRRGKRHIVDMSYYPQLSNTCNNLVGRPNDDASPTRLASELGLPVTRLQVRLEGGNFLSDGRGHCFRNPRVANRVNCFSGWCYTPEELDEILGDAYECEVHEMESLGPGVIDHIDMSIAFIAPDEVLVGRYDPVDDPVNAPILDRNAATLAAMGYNVTRIPMPSPFCMQAIPGCIGQEHLVQSCSEPNSTRIWATFTNSIRVGDAMLVPVYDWIPEELAATYLVQEQEALAAYQTVLDRAFGEGAVTVIPIPADTIIPCQGAFHCVTMTY